jgi:hypothetical protein
MAKRIQIEGIAESASVILKPKDAAVPVFHCLGEGLKVHASVDDQVHGKPLSITGQYLMPRNEKNPTRLLPCRVWKC